MHRLLTDKNQLVVLGIIVLAVAMRLLPHPPNVTPVAALALFGGAYIQDKRFALALPLVVLMLSDLLLGLHDTLIFVYIGFMLTAMIGMILRKRMNGLTIVTASLASSVMFFVLTNFGVWMTSDLYSADLSGLITCYIAAIPFFQNSVLGNLFFTALLFGGFALYARLAITNRPRNDLIS